MERTQQPYRILLVGPPNSGKADFAFMDTFGVIKPHNMALGSVMHLHCKSMQIAPNTQVKYSLLRCGYKMTQLDSKTVIQKFKGAASALILFYNPIEVTSEEHRVALQKYIEGYDIPKFLVATFRDQDKSYPFQGFEWAGDTFVMRSHITNRRREEVNDVIKHILNYLIDPEYAWHRRNKLIAIRGKLKMYS